MIKRFEEIDKLVLLTDISYPKVLGIIQYDDDTFTLLYSSCNKNDFIENDPQELLKFIIENSNSSEIEMENINEKILLENIIYENVNNMARINRRGRANVICAGNDLYELLEDYCKNNFFKIYNSKLLKNNELIMTYKDDAKNDGGMFMKYIIESNDLELFTFNHNEISKTKNYYTHLIFKNYDQDTII